MSKTANTPQRFVADAINPGGDIKRLFLDRGNYYSTTGGHGACRGCGEVTATRLVMSTNHAITEKQRREHIRELESLLSRLAVKQAAVAKFESARAERIGQLVSTLQKRLYLYE